MRVTDEMVEAGLSAARDASEARLPRYSVVRAILEAALSHAAGQEAPINPAEIDRKLVGVEAVAWRTIKPCGLRRYMTQAQYDANPSVQKWYEPFKCADCRATAQPPASAEVVTFVSCTCHEPRQKELCLNKHRCVRAYPLAASSGRKGDRSLLHKAVTGIRKEVRLTSQDQKEIERG